VEDLTEFVTAAARTNDPRAVAAFSNRFSAARFHLPLATLDGVKNREEAALELGASLPVHRLRLDTGLLAMPLFTTLPLLREAARRLGWKTDDKAIKTLPVSGSTALDYFQKILFSPDIDRVIVNPLSESGALHLARTEVEQMASGESIRNLWLYSRNGALKRPVAIEGGSFLSTLLGAAGRAVSRKETTTVVEIDPIPVALPEGPFSALAAELYELLRAEATDNLELVAVRTREGVKVDTTPALSSSRWQRVNAVVEKHLLSSPPGTKVCLRMDRGSVALSASTAPEPRRPPEPPLSYIPLDPEPEDETR
jgi:hypothetical protein